MREREREREGGKGREGGRGGGREGGRGRGEGREGEGEGERGRERKRERERGQCYNIFLYRTKKVSIPSALFPQIVGKNSCNLAAIRQATSTQIDIDRHSKQSSNRTITVRYASIPTKKKNKL